MAHPPDSKMSARMNMIRPKSYVLHAEANAITKVAKSNNSSEGSTLYITTSPCMECSKLIIQAGIKRVVYEEKYRITDGLDLLERARIELVHLPEPRNVERMIHRRRKENEEQERQTDHIFTDDYQRHPYRGNPGGELDHRNPDQKHRYR